MNTKLVNDAVKIKISIDKNKTNYWKRAEFKKGLERCIEAMTNEEYYHYIRRIEI